MCVYVSRWKSRFLAQRNHFVGREPPLYTYLSFTFFSLFLNQIYLPKQKKRTKSSSDIGYREGEFLLIFQIACGNDFVGSNETLCVLQIFRLDFLRSVTTTAQMMDNIELNINYYDFLLGFFFLLFNS